MAMTGLGTEAQLKDPDYMPPLAKAAPLGVQHVLSMFVSNVTPAIIVAGAAGFGFGTPGVGELIYMIQMSMLFAGVATLFQTIGLGPVGARLPIVQGTSFAFLPIMIPLVAFQRELEILKELVDSVAEDVKAETGAEFHYLVGTMIELPRAALRAEDIAQSAEFFSFGTNDLTQTTFGLSRDDAGNFLPAYEARGIIDQDPFISLDALGVGELVEIAAERGRKGRPDLKLGICGEHGGDPASIRFCQKVGLDYVSCSPFRVPIARLAAAQAALAEVERDV